MKENDAQSLCHNSKHWLDGSYVDENVIIHVGRRHKTTKCKYENYHCVCKGHRYDFIDYDSNMVHIHSIKSDFLIQEIYGKLTLYNFSSCITKTITKRENVSTTHKYNFNHTQMQKFVRLYVIGVVKDLEKLINRFLVPVRPGRKFKRILRRQSAEPLFYR